MAGAPAISTPAAPGWPAPVEALNESGRSPIVLLCEHASNYIPPEYGGLGLADSELERHIAWDPGAAEVARSLSRWLDAACFLGTCSRLLIDLNRPLEAATSIPCRSEATEIAGNRDLPLAERDRRSGLIFHPFHQRVRAHLEGRERDDLPTLLVSIHSFTPVFLGYSRPWHAGVLYAQAVGLADFILSGLRRDPELHVGANVPYDISRDEDYAVPVHGDDRGIPAVLIEIRQDLIADARGVEAWADRLATILKDASSAAARMPPSGGR